MFSNVDWKDIVVRALKTFVQAAVAVFLVSEEPLSYDVFLAAVAGGASAVWNLLLGVFKK